MQEEEAAIAFLGVAAGMFVVFLLVAMVISVVIALVLWKAMGSIPQNHRKLPAGTAWLVLIPCLGGIWLIVYNICLSTSFQSYFESTGNPRGNCGLGLAIGHAVCTPLIVIPLLGYLISFTGLILLIVFLVTVSKLAGEVRNQPPATFD